MNPIRSRRRRVVITGASGELGSHLVSGLADRYDFLLSDIRPPRRTQSFPFLQADVTQIEALRPLLHADDTVIHLAGIHDSNTAWESLWVNNIAGTYNLLQAASEAGCRRVIFISSSHVVLGGPDRFEIRADAPVQPLTLYGASKASGEALASYFAGQHNLSVICLRLGWVTAQGHPRLTPGSQHLSLVITPADLCRLVAASIEAPEDLRFGIFNGLSANQVKRLSIAETEQALNYRPQDDAYALARRNYIGIARLLARRIKRRLKLLLSQSQKTAATPETK